MRSSNRARQACFAFLIASLLASLPLSSPAAPSNRQARARAAYARASRMRTTLQSEPEKSRKKADYENLVRAFKSVHFYDPAYGKSPLALEAVGDLYAEMGRRFDNDEYYRTAIQAYRFLISQYPNNGLSRDAHYTIAEIYRSDLGDTDEARKAFREFLEKYPRAANAGEAREKLKQLDRQVAEAKAEPPPKAERKTATGTAIVTAVRRWVGPNYTRIVVNVDGEVNSKAVGFPTPTVLYWTCSTPS